MDMINFRNKLNEIEKTESDWCLEIKFSLPQDSDDMDSMFKSIEDELGMQSDSADIEDLNSLTVVMKFCFNSKAEADKVAKEKYDILNDHVDDLSIKVIGSESEEEITEGSMEDKECNETPAGKYCPKHGMSECTDMLGRSVVEKTLREADCEEWHLTVSYAQNKKKHEHDDLIIGVVGIDPFGSGDETDRRDLMFSFETKDEAEDAAKLVDALKRKVAGIKTSVYCYSDKNLDEAAVINFSIDGSEAESFIKNLLRLSGGNQDDFDTSEFTCDSCGESFDRCQCGSQDCCNDCGETLDNCTCDSSEDTCVCGLCGKTFDCCECPDNEEMAFESDNDYGHVDHSESGEEIDPDEYMYKAPNGKQRVVKSMTGDNPLLQEDVKQIHSKLKYSYRKYLEEAELATSNTGSQSPLTANSRDKFDKDPYGKDEPVTDGTRSPLSKIGRQSVNR